jgi:outer membrane lipoprotein-sorting protein
VKHILVIWMLTLYITCGITQSDVNKIIKDVQKKYQNIQMVYVDFKQVNRFKLTDIKSEINGTIWISQNDRFRLETEDQVMVSDGTTFWRFNKLENQVLIDYAKKSQQDVFLNNFLFKIDEVYFSQVAGETKIDGKKVYEIKLTPRKPDESFFNYVKVWLYDKSWELEKVLYVDFNENEVEYLIEKMELNPVVTGNVFNFEIPEGVEAVDLRF